MTKEQREEKIAKIKEATDALTSKIDSLIDEAQAAMPDGVTIWVFKGVLDKDGNRLAFAGEHIAIAALIDIGKLA